MSYAQLKAFHAVAASGGFSKAAARLGLSQPAVSDHIRKLETAYGVELFSRTRRKVELTDLGRSLFAITERHFESEAQAVELLSRARELEHGLITGNSARLMESLERLEIDFAVVAERPASDIFIARKIREDRLVCLLT